MEVESWATAATAVAGLVVAFRLGVWFYDRRAAAVAEIVGSFCREIAVYRRDAADGEITDEEAREIARAVGRFVTDLEALGALLCEESR